MAAAMTSWPRRARISREAPAAAAVPGKHGTVGCAVGAAAAADPRAQRVTTRLARVGRRIMATPEAAIARAIIMSARLARQQVAYR